MCRYEENRPHRLHHDADDGMHSLSPAMAGVGHRKNITAMSANTVTALTTLQAIFRPRPILLRKQP